MWKTQLKSYNVNGHLFVFPVWKLLKLDKSKFVMFCTLQEKEKIKNEIQKLYKFYDAWVYSMLDQGCLFFCLKINLSYSYSDKTKENYFESEKQVKEGLQNIMTYFSKFPFIECCLGSIEVGESENQLLHCIIAFRSNFNCKNIIQSKIELLLSTSVAFYDYKLSFLNTFKLIIKSTRDLSKDFAVSRPFNYAFFSVFSKALDFIHRSITLNLSIKDSIQVIQLYTKTLYYDCGCEDGSSSKIPFGLYSIFSCIPIKLKNNVLNEVIYFLGVYFQYKKIILLNNNYYIKIDNTLISYKLFGDKNYIITHFYSFMEELKDAVFDFLDITLLSYIFSSNYEKILEQISIILNFSLNKLNFDVLEFKDGLYFADQNIFYKTNTIIEKNSNLLKNLTIRYYDVTYKHLNELKTPKMWKKKLNLNFTEKEFIAFCVFFRNILFNTLILTKNNILLLFGVSNSGKSRLILDIAAQSYGVQNIDFLSSDTTFLFENLIEKELAIIDNFTFKSNMYTKLKALDSGDVLSFNERYPNILYGKPTTKTIIASNYNAEIKKILEEDTTLKNRICFFLLNTVCPLSPEEYNQIINEIPLILIYCNKLYFKESKQFLFLNN